MFTKLLRKEENYAWCFFFFLKETIFLSLIPYFVVFPTITFTIQEQHGLLSKNSIVTNFLRRIIIIVFTTFSQYLLMW